MGVSVKIFGIDFFLDKNPIHWLLCTNEVWKQHKEFSLYWVSSHGRIKTHSKKGWTIKAKSETSNGYRKVTFCTNNFRKSYLMHRMIAEYFLPNSNVKDVVNHKDFDRTNNRYCNLEWCTQKFNVAHSDNHDRTFKKAVLQLDFEGNIIAEHRSAFEAEENNKELFFGTLISRCCLGKQDSHAGYRWEFKDGSSKKYVPYTNIIHQLSIDGLFIKEWDRASTAAKELSIDSGDISRVCKGTQKSAGGFKWIRINN